MQGPDVSRWQSVNWPVAAQSFDAAIVKASGGDAGLYVDSKLASNQAGLRATGKPAGWYHFAGAGDPIREAEYFAGNANWQPGEVMVLDREAPWPTDPGGWSLAFLQHLNALLPDAPLWLYTSASRVQSLARCADLAGLWCASYGMNTGLRGAIPDPGPFRLVAWQFTSVYPRPAGISGTGLDWNDFYLTADEWTGSAHHAAGDANPISADLGVALTKEEDDMANYLPLVIAGIEGAQAAVQQGGAGLQAAYYVINQNEGTYRWINEVQKDWLVSQGVEVKENQGGALVDGMTYIGPGAYQVVVAKS